MFAIIGGFWRITTLLVLAVFVSACMPMEAPRLSGPPVITPNQAKALGSAPISGPGITFALEPLTNAPADMRYAFEDALKQYAPTRQMKIITTDDPAATYRIKAYLSALGDYNQTLIVYVLDIFDAAGTRVHRVSGQIQAKGTLTDPWMNVKESGAVALAARQAIDEMGNWLAQTS